MSAQPAFEFDRALALDRDAAGVYHGEVTDRWGVLSGVPNGGLVMCYALAGLTSALPKPDPLTMTAHFLRPAEVGPIEVHTEVIKVGKRNATGSARLVQNGKERLRALATFGQWDTDAIKVIASAPPELPPREQCLVHAETGAPDIAQRFDNRIDPATISWAQGKRNGEMVLRGWMRFADGREPDPLAMPLFADGLPPPLFNAVSPGWVPTIELTVQFRGRPAPGWLRAQFRTRFVSGSFLEEDGEIWDDRGELVAISRQLATLPR